MLTTACEAASGPAGSVAFEPDSATVALVKDTQKARVHTGRQAGTQPHNHFELSPRLSPPSHTHSVRHKNNYPKTEQKKKKQRGCIFRCMLAVACWDNALKKKG